MKIKEIKTEGNHKYSRTFFDDYEMRVVVLFETDNGEQRFDVYTTNVDFDEIYKFLEKQFTQEVNYFKIECYATKTMDDIDAKIIEDCLNDL